MNRASKGIEKKEPKQKRGLRRDRVLGIDPGSARTGYAVLEMQEEGKARYLECGVIEAVANAPLEQRLLTIGQGIEEVLDDFRPTQVAVEDLFYHRNARSALALGQARGAVLLVVAKAGLPVFSYAPALVKKVVVGRGRASKIQVQCMVQHICGLRTAPASDAADALAVALCHAAILGLSDDQKKGISKVTDT